MIFSKENHLLLYRTVVFEGVSKLMKQLYEGIMYVVGDRRAEGQESQERAPRRTLF